MPMRPFARVLPRHRLSLTLLAAASVSIGGGGAVLGCHAARREPAVAPGTAATLQVQNQGYADMVIYVLRGTQRIRLGLSTGNTTQRFRIPADVVAGAGTLRFIADPVGGTRAPVSDEISIRPGDTVTLIIPPS